MIQGDSGLPFEEGLPKFAKLKKYQQESREDIDMALITSKKMFEKAYKGGYAIGAFNVNNMEIIQGITEAAMEVQAPLILQVSAGARRYAKHVYLMKLIEAALEDTGFPYVFTWTTATVLKHVNPV